MKIVASRLAWLLVLWLVASVAALIRDAAVGWDASQRDPLALTLATLSGGAILGWCWVNRAWRSNRQRRR